MRIDGTSNRNSIGRPTGSQTKGQGGAVFRPAMATSTKPSAPNVPMAPTSGIEAILALQGVDNQKEKKRQAVRHGQSLLDTLEEVKADLLVGNIGEGRLNKLLALVTRSRQQADPDLDALIDDIDLRARVELAKLGRFVN